MKIRRRAIAIATSLLLGAMFGSARAAVYQYTVDSNGRRAYLWIPPECTRVKGVMIALNNLLEQSWLDDPIIRKAAADEGIGIIFVGSGNGGLNAQMSGMAPQALTKMLKDFANESGYPEIESAPIFAMGHSQNGFLSWTIPNWNPERTIAAFPIKTYPLPDPDTAPGSADFKTNPPVKIEGVPMCYLVGQTTEWPQPGVQQSDRDFFWPVVRDSAIKWRSTNESNLVGVVTETGAGHFDWSEHSAKFLALYLHKACFYRLPKDIPPTGAIILNKIDKESGWLTDTGGMEPDTFPAAPYKQYKGDPKKAYWFFDEETAKAAVEFEGDRKPRQRQLLSFMLPSGQLADVTPGPASVPFVPDADGITFKVTPVFLPKVPQKLIGGGTALGHADGPINLRVVVGPAIQIGPDTFRVQFNRNEQGGATYIQEEHPGDATFRRAVQPGSINIPPRNTAGKTQVLIFPEIPNQKADVKSVELTATADSNLPVDYYIIAGPAEMDRQPDGTVHGLKIVEIPAKAKYPIKITVVAYQYGKSSAPQVQSAAPVTRTFLLER